jgi:hypothetical protein
MSLEVRPFGQPRKIWMMRFGKSVISSIDVEHPSQSSIARPSRCYAVNVGDGGVIARNPTPVLTAERAILPVACRFHGKNSSSVCGREYAPLHKAGWSAK